MSENFRIDVERAVFRGWREDPIFPTKASHPRELNDEEFDDFSRQVDDVVEFAHENGIKDAGLTVDTFTDVIKSHYPRRILH